ncbi:hypothetical protein CORC01_01682 [Colletotrichum orchidophilum]|uniref:ribonuclease H n=1 Tax=Colletotrichum orchidophilum TaxID=1209926 RepID=A0A1G4BND9_9PEZI|nr:uncharacterized protein CORC01_01682 [Colletotrichum orchidophilum]OHF02924.1 hypothetical protein CORC01_01682 [Colletotrichum orchidophilum]
MLGYDDDDGIGSRLFEPRASDTHRMVPKAELVVYDPQKQVLGLQMYSWSKKGVTPDPGSFVVYIDGACRGNGTGAARASWGVYFGPGSRYNACGLLAGDLPQTNARAEIEALVQALRIIGEITEGDFSLSQIKIATDSEYLAHAMSLWIGEWIENEGMTARGRNVAHFAVLRDLHEQLDEMTYGDDGGLNFMFWAIPREENKEADALANQAFSWFPEPFTEGD